MQNNQKIPEGWSVKRLGECVEGTQLGGNYENSESNKGLPLIKMGNLSRGKIVLDKIEYIPENTIHNEKDILHYGDLLFNTRNTLELVGKVSIWKNELPTALFNSNILRFTFNPNIIKNSFFMNYYFNSEKGLKLLRARAIGTTSVAAIYWRDCINMKILLPPLAEQEKIAGILGTWDEAIEKLSNLIEQKKLLKKGLMQKLLTGKTRLPGFTQPWKDVKLGKICKLETATSKSAFIDENGKYYIIDMGAVSTEGTLISSKRTNTCEDLLKINDIVMPKDDIGGGNIIGKTAIIKQENTYVLSDHVFKLNIHDSDANFISYLINSYGYNKYMRRMSCGSAILGLSKKDVEKCLLYIPSDISEQQAIADVLSTEDDEINLLNQKLEALKKQKKGLMQQLLTGQIRVKVN